MSEPTEEQKRKTIRVARVAFKNMLEQQFFPAMQQYVEMCKERRALFADAPWMPKPQPAVQQEDPTEPALEALLAEVKNSMGEKK